jgi:hypothetical protein
MIYFVVHTWWQSQQTGNGDPHTHIFATVFISSQKMHLFPSFLLPFLHHGIGHSIPFTFCLPPSIFFGIIDRKRTIKKNFNFLFKAMMAGIKLVAWAIYGCVCSLALHTTKGDGWTTARTGNHARFICR